MIRVLSTKKLAPNQRQYLLNAGFSVTEADFISIKNKEAEVMNVRNNLIFTSSNAVKSLAEHPESESLKDKPCFCVGEKTKKNLLKNGFQVKFCAEKASSLAGYIEEAYSDESFTFFSGNLRMETLPQMLNDSEIDWNEIEVYETVLTSIAGPESDAILFFSPSAVESFLQMNTITSQQCFCIGETTAAALSNQTTNIVISNKPSVENTIIQCIKSLQG